MGEITAITAMGTDVERIVNSMLWFHQVWGSLLDIAIACWLLGRQLSLACLAPIVLVLGRSTELLRLTEVLLNFTAPIKPSLLLPPKSRVYS